MPVGEIKFTEAYIEETYADIADRVMTRETDQPSTANLSVPRYPYTK